MNQLVFHHKDETFAIPFEACTSPFSFMIKLMIAMLCTQVWDSIVNQIGPISAETGNKLI